MLALPNHNHRHSAADDPSEVPEIRNSPKQPKQQSGPTRSKDKDNKKDKDDDKSKSGSKSATSNPKAEEVNPKLLRNQEIVPFSVSERDRVGRDVCWLFAQPTSAFI